MANIEQFVGKDTYGNILTDTRPFAGDARYTARSEDLARQFDWNMMEYQNFWNSPEQQVSRLEAAGLNPNFYLGGNAGTTPAAAGGTQQGHQMTSSSGKFQQAMEAGAAIAADALGFQRQLMEYSIAKDANRIKDYEAKTNRMLAQAQIPNIQSEQDYRDYYQTKESEKRQKEYEATVRKLNAEADKLASDKKVSDETVNKIKEEIETMKHLQEYYDEQVKTLATQQQVNRALVGYYGSMSNYYNTIAEPTANELVERAGMDRNNARKLAQEAAKASVEGRILQFQEHLQQKYGEWKEYATIMNIVADSMEKSTHAIQNTVSTLVNPGGLFTGKGGTTTTTTKTKPGEMTTTTRTNTPFNNTDTNPSF